MSNSLSLSPDTPILFILLAVLIFLALMAALGSWFRGRGLTRQDAEDLFSTAQERNREELQKFESRLEETRQMLDKTSTDLTARLERTETGLSTTLQQTQSSLIERLERNQSGLVERMERTENGLRTIVEQAGRSQQECLTRDLGGMRTDMTTALADARRSNDDGMHKMQTMLGNVRDEIEQAGTSVRESLVELARQQQEAKAHSAIQLCEALISSLGTLRNTIAVQLANEIPTQIGTQTPANVLAEFPSTPQSGTREIEGESAAAPEDHFPEHHSTPAGEAEISLHEHEGNKSDNWADMGVEAGAPAPEVDSIPEPAPGETGSVFSDPHHKSWDAVQRNEGGWTPAADTNDVDTQSENENEAPRNDNQDNNHIP